MVYIDLRITDLSPKKITSPTRSSWDYKHSLKFVVKSFLKKFSSGAKVLEVSIAAGRQNLIPSVTVKLNDSNAFGDFADTKDLVETER